MSLSGKKALITGARRNIGRGIALALAQEGCGIGINDIERDADAEQTLRLIREIGPEAEFYQGAIVSISSVHARRSWPQSTCYAVAKAGILRLTESMAAELGPHGIRCNAILPGTWM